MSYIEDIKRRKEEVRNNILKSFGAEDTFEKAHQDGDMHPNGKWVWVSSANGGRGDWRALNGRSHKKHQTANAAGNVEKKVGVGSKNAGISPKDEALLKVGNVYEKFASYYKFQKKNGVKYPSFGIVREAKSENNGRGAIRFYGTKKELQKELKKFNSLTNSKISIDNFERESRHGEVSWDTTFNPKDGKLYKNDNEIPEEAATKPKTSSKSGGLVSAISTVNDAESFLKKNADKWFDYQYGQLDDEKLEKQFDEANKYIKDFEQFEDKEQDEAMEYKEKMENKGYKVIDVGGNSDTYVFAVLKKSNKK